MLQTTTSASGKRYLHGVIETEEDLESVRQVVSGATFGRIWNNDADEFEPALFWTSTTNARNGNELQVGGTFRLGDRISILEFGALGSGRKSSGVPPTLGV